MSSFLVSVLGTWSINSLIDPRWNAQGVVYVHIVGRVPASERKVEELKVLYGSTPRDLVYSDSTGRLDRLTGEAYSSVVDDYESI